MSDFDGVILRTEFAKPVGWGIAELYIRGVVGKNLIEALENRDKIAISEVRAICKEYALDIEYIIGIAGESRKATRDAVWDKYLASYDIKKKEEFENTRNSIKDILLYEMSERIEGNIDFLVRACENDIELGLVTQAKRKDILHLARRFDLPLEIFSYIMCVGDRAWDSAYNKTIGYAQVCALLGVSPLEILAIEDSKSGIKAAGGARVGCIGVRDHESNQDLSDALIVVSPDLGRIREQKVFDNFLNLKRDEFIQYLKNYLGENKETKVA